MTILDSANIGVIGLGYVGLPLALEFGKRYPTLGYDTNSDRICQLNLNIDSTLEASEEALKKATQLKFSSDPTDLKNCNFYIIAVPTPIDSNKQPDLLPLLKASELVGGLIERDDIVIFESTVYPGCTEEQCIPVIEKLSGLRYNRDFFAGYSPERINPGDKQRKLTSIVKVTSGSTPEIASYVDALYASIIEAGTFKASNIKVAEASKVIENTQRDINIAVVNELSIIFERLGISTEDVLEAAETKWNFLPFRPGLVGGHCIGVDPYYLVHKSEQAGYHPQLISAARRVNEKMGEIVAHRIARLMTSRRLHIVDSRILILGVAFKENCPDLRNTRVTDIYHELTNWNAKVDLYDPWVDNAEAERELGIPLIETLKPSSYDAIVIAVAHDDFKQMGIDTIRSLNKPNGVIFDIKYLFPEESVDARL